MDKESIEFDFLLTADSAEAVNGKLYMLGGGWDRRAVADFAQPQSFAVVLGVSIPWSETNRPIPLTLSIADVDSGPIMPAFQTQLTIGRPPHARPGQRQRVMLALNVMAVLPRASEYVIEAGIDDLPARRLTFFVDPAQQSQAKP